jgi:hypothetical protein
MNISIHDESLLTLPQAAALLPGRRGRPVSVASLTRWIQQGVRGPAGQRVRLEGVRLGGRWLTTAQALDRFVGRLTPAELAPREGDRQP